MVGETNGIHFPFGAEAFLDCLVLSFLDAVDQIQLQYDHFHPTRLEPPPSACRASMLINFFRRPPRNSHLIERSTTPRAARCLIRACRCFLGSIAGELQTPSSCIRSPLTPLLSIGIVARIALPGSWQTSSASRLRYDYQKTPNGIETVALPALLVSCSTTTRLCLWPSLSPQPLQPTHQALISYRGNRAAGRVGRKTKNPCAIPGLAGPLVWITKSEAKAPVVALQPLAQNVVYKCTRLSEVARSRAAIVKPLCAGNHVARNSPRCRLIRQYRRQRHHRGVTLQS